MAKIKVRGTAEKDFTPERMTIYMTITVSGGNSGEVLARGKERVEQILAALQEKLQIEPEHVTLEQEQMQEQYNRKGYAFSKRISVSLQADLKILESVTELLQTLPGVEYTTHFTLESIPEKEQEVMQAAVADSRKKAELLAAVSGQQITGMEEINYEFPEPVEHFYRDIAVASGCMQEKLASRLQLAPEKISKSVDIIWLSE